LWDRRDGRLGLEGYLEPEHRAAFRSLIDQLAAPRPATDAIPDTRSTPQRNADALLEICGLARAAQDCPSTAGRAAAFDRDHRLGCAAHRHGGREPRLWDAHQGRGGPSVGV
jgi:hypothetical protein